MRRGTRPRRPGSVLPPLALLFLAACGQPEERGAQAPAPGASVVRGTAGQQIVLPPEAAGGVNEGIAEYRQGRYLEAAAAFEKARDQVPADERVSNLLGTALLQGKRYTPARMEFRRILTLHQEAIEPRLGLARISVRLGEYEEADRLFREVLSRDHGNLLALYNLGWLRYRLGDTDEARRLLSSLLERKQDHPEGHYMLGLAYARLGDAVRAEEEFRRVVDLAPENSQAHFNLAGLYSRTGRPQMAAQEEEIYRRLSGRMASDRAAEGTARDLFLKGDFEAALKEYDRLSHLSPQSGRFQMGRGFCYLKLGKTDEAISALAKAASLDPKLSDAHFHLAVLYQQRGEDEKSERERRAFEALEAIGENKTGF